MEAPAPFAPVEADAAGVLSWVHIGDLHITAAGEQNEIDLQAIVREVNAAFAGTISFVYLPGDIADDGSRGAYRLVRQAMDRLRVPWCAILGDHDVHEESHANYLEAMAGAPYYSFTVGAVRFLAMNAFDVPHPALFAVLPEQLAWVEQQLREASALDHARVLLLHCYPSDLKAGREELTALVRHHKVMLIDMGHTHYNEVANDGHTLYTATRSTGQIEEGPVGYSVTNLDGGVVSWRFVELGRLPAVIITSPADRRLRTHDSPAMPRAGEPLLVRAKIWGAGARDLRVTAQLGGQSGELRQVAGSNVWRGELAPERGNQHGASRLQVRVERGAQLLDEDTIELALEGDPAEAERAAIDQENALAAWPEHGLLGTQLGPNKNGRKW